MCAFWVFFGGGGESYAGPTDRRGLVWGKVRLCRAGGAAVAFIKLSIADEGEVGGGAAFVNAYDPNSSIA